MLIGLVKTFDWYLGDNMIMNNRMIATSLMMIVVVTFIVGVTGLFSINDVAGEGETEPYSVSGSTLTITSDIENATDIEISNEQWEKITIVDIDNGVSKIADSTLSKIGEGKLLRLTAPITFKDNVGKILGHDQLNMNAGFVDADGYTHLICQKPTSEGLVSSFQNIKVVEIRNASAIESSVFKDQALLETVILPDKILDIGTEAFEGCVKLKNVYPASSETKEGLIVPASLSKMGDNAFKGCSEIATVTFEDRGDSEPLIFGEYIFSDCEGLNQVTFSEDIGYIYKGMFDGCTSLKQLTIPDTITYIYENAFSRSGLVSITIPASVRTIESTVFMECASLTTAKFENPDTNWQYSDSRGNLQDSTNMFYKCTSLANVSLPGNLEKIPAYTFYACKSLTSISFPEKTVTIGSNAFQDTGLTSLVIPEGIVSIEANAFRDCVNLSYVQMPSTLTCKVNSWTYGVGQNSFTGIGTSAESLKIVINGNPGFDSYAFKNIEIDELYINGSPTFKKSNTFTNVKVGKIIVAGGLGFNCEYFDFEYTDDECNELLVWIKGDDGTFSQKKMLVWDEIKDGTLKIGKDIVAIAPSVLQDSSLESIVVDDTNDYFKVESGALYYQSNGKISEGLVDAKLVTVLKGDAAVKDFVVPSGVKTILSYAFQDNDVNTILIPESVKDIQRDSLTGIDSILLTSIDSLSFDKDAMDVGTKCYLPIGTSADASSVMSFGGYYKECDGKIIVISVEAGVADINIESVSGTDEKKLTITLKENYTKSSEKISVKKGFSDAVAVVRGEDGSYSFTLGESVTSEKIVIEGITINKFSVTTKENAGYEASFSVPNVKEVPVGTEVRFTITPSKGYTISNLKVLLNNVELEKEQNDKWNVYSFVITQDSAITIQGINEDEKVSVTFQKGDGQSEQFSQQSIIKGTNAQFPGVPTVDGKVFIGWFNGDELYDFTSSVTKDLTLVAKWANQNEAKQVTLTFSADNGQIKAVSLIDNKEVKSGDKIYSGSKVLLTYYSKIGYEVRSWVVNDKTNLTNSQTLTLDVSSDTVVSVKAEYTVSAFPYLETDIETPFDGVKYELLWKVKGTAGWNQMVFTPSIMGDYVYSWSGSEIYKISLTTGEVVKKVETGTEVTGYYKFTTVGNGYVLAGYTGQVYDADLNPVFVIHYDEMTPTKEHKAYYNDGYFYIFTETNLYKFKAEDQDEGENNVQLPCKTAQTKYRHYISTYQGQSNLIFTDKFIVGLELDGNKSQKRLAVTYDLDTLEAIDSYEFADFENAGINTGYISYYNGIFYFSTYSPNTGLFSTSDEEWNSLASVELTQDGRFNPVTINYYDLGTNSYTSSFIIVGNYGYINAGTVFKVYDISSMECVAELDSAMAHGNMAVSVQGDSVIAYVQPYGYGKTLYAFKHDQSTNKLSNVSLRNVLTNAEYCSQIVHFGPNGQILYYNDSGYLYCIAPYYVAEMYDGNEKIGEVKFYENQSSTLSSVNKAGYKFVGWYTDADCTGSPVDSVRGNEDMKIYAKFAQVTTDDLVNGVKVSAFSDNGKVALFQIESGKNVSKVSVVVGYSAYVTVAEGTFLCPTFTETFETTVTNGLVEFSTKDDVRMESVSVFCCYVVDGITYSTTLTNEFVPMMSSVVEISADDGVTLMLDGSKVVDGQTLTYGSYVVSVDGEDGARYTVNGVAVDGKTKFFFSGQKLTISKA